MGSARSGRRPEAVQTGEDQIETEVELAGEVVAGLAHVLGNGLGEVGIVVSAGNWLRISIANLSTWSVLSKGRVCSCSAKPKVDCRAG